MIEIKSTKGENYSFDPETGRIFKDGFLMSSADVEPIFSNTQTNDDMPRFSGILLKNSNSILSLSGKISQITDPNLIF